MGGRKGWRVDLDEGLAYGPNRLLAAFTRRPGHPDFTVRIEATDGRDLTIREITEIAEAVGDAVREAMQSRTLN